MKDDYRKVPGLHGGFTIEPLPDPEELAELYADEYYQQCSSATYSADYSEDELAWKRLRCDLVIHLLRRQGLSSGRLLDLGSGEGFLVAAALRAGLDGYGIDFSAFAVERFHPELRERIAVGDLIELLDTAIERGDRHDVYTLQHVVEHVPEPDALLEKVGRAAGPGGLVVVTMPNDENPVQHLALERRDIKDEFWVAPPQHLHYFDTRSAVTLAEAVGYEVLDLITDFPIDLYLLHPGSNYAVNPEVGKSAHRARVDFELMLGRQGLDRMRELGEAQARCGIGRDLTMVLRRIAA